MAGTREGDSEGRTEPREARAARLKERVYITFTALATVLALSSHHVSVGDAVATLAIAVIGTLLAVFVADLVSHVVVHAKLPDEQELRQMARVVSGGLAAVVLPFGFLVLVMIDVWGVQTALLAGAIALTVALVGIGFLAVRRARLPVGQRLLVLFAEFALGAVVIGLELLLHV